MRVLVLCAVLSVVLCAMLAAAAARHQPKKPPRNTKQSRLLRRPKTDVDEVGDYDDDSSGEGDRTRLNKWMGDGNVLQSGPHAQHTPSWMTGGNLMQSGGTHEHNTQNKWQGGGNVLQCVLWSCLLKGPAGKNTIQKLNKLMDEGKVVMPRSRVCLLNHNAEYCVGEQLDVATVNRALRSVWYN